MVQYTATPDYYRDYICHDFYVDNNTLTHYGVPGMKWGVRKQRVLVGRRGRRFMTGTSRRPVTTRANKSSSRKGLTAQQKQKLKKVAIGAGIVAGTAAAAYGGYKLNKAAVKRAKWNDEVAMLRNLNRAKTATDANMKKRYEDLADIYKKRKAAGKYSARHKVRMLLYNE